jgi:hypothetical protein
MSAQWFKTRDGLSAVIFATDFEKLRCYIGAYQSGNEWYPTTWCKGGRWHDTPGYKRGLDLMMENNETSQRQV